jgi:hypothetical protein
VPRDLIYFTRSATTVALTLVLLAPFGLVSPAHAKGSVVLNLCSNPGSPTTPVQHVMVVMLENASYFTVTGPGNNAPYESGYLATHCGLATQMYGATHTSAANYLALTAGRYPATSPPGCGTVSGCTAAWPSLFSQADTEGAGWKSYQESMPFSCDPHTSSPYKIGHNPALFYPLTDCASDDVAEPDLTAPSGPLYTDLVQRTLPGFVFVTPNLNHDGEGSGGITSADTWLQEFLNLVASTPAYQEGTLAIFVTYDEGTGSDRTVGEDCTNQIKDLSGDQPSCHVAAFIVYPWASGHDGTFYTHYSVTRTVEDLLGLPSLAGASTANSMSTRFGL